MNNEKKRRTNTKPRRKRGESFDEREDKKVHPADITNPTKTSSSSRNSEAQKTRRINHSGSNNAVVRKPPIPVESDKQRRNKDKNSNQNLTNNKSRRKIVKDQKMHTNDRDNTSLYITPECDEKSQNEKDGPCIFLQRDDATFLSNITMEWSESSGNGKKETKTSGRRNEADEKDKDRRNIVKPRNKIRMKAKAGISNNVEEISKRITSSNHESNESGKAETRRGKQQQLEGGKSRVIPSKITVSSSVIKNEEKDELNFNERRIHKSKSLTSLYSDSPCRSRERRNEISHNRIPVSKRIPKASSISKENNDEVKEELRFNERRIHTKRSKSLTNLHSESRPRKGRDELFHEFKNLGARDIKKTLRVSRGRVRRRGNNGLKQSISSSSFDSTRPINQYAKNDSFPGENCIDNTRKSPRRSSRKASKSTDDEYKTYSRSLSAFKGKVDNSSAELGNSRDARSNDIRNKASSQKKKKERRRIKPESLPTSISIPTSKSISSDELMSPPPSEEVRIDCPTDAIKPSNLSKDNAKMKYQKERIRSKGYQKYLMKKKLAMNYDGHSSRESLDASTISFDTGSIYSIGTRRSYGTAPTRLMGMNYDGHSSRESLDASTIYTASTRRSLDTGTIYSSSTRRSFGTATTRSINARSFGSNGHHSVGRRRSLDSASTTSGSTGIRSLDMGITRLERLERLDKLLDSDAHREVCSYDGVETNRSRRRKIRPRGSAYISRRTTNDNGFYQKVTEQKQETSMKQSSETNRKERMKSKREASTKHVPIQKEASVGSHHQVTRSRKPRRVKCFEE